MLTDSGCKDTKPELKLQTYGTEFYIKKLYGTKKHKV